MRISETERKAIRAEIKTLKDENDSGELIALLHKEPVLPHELRLRALQAAIQVMREQDDRQGLVALLRNEVIAGDRWFRREARSATAQQLADKGDAAGLLNLLKEPAIKDAAGTRLRIVDALAKAQGHDGPPLILSRGAAGVHAFCELVEDDPNKTVRFTAAEALIKIGDEACAPSLVRALGDEDQSVRVKAIQGVIALKVREAVPRLVAMTALGASVERGLAADALVEIRDEAAIAHLLELAQHEQSKRTQRRLTRTAERVREAVGAS